MIHSFFFCVFLDHDFVSVHKKALLMTYLYEKNSLPANAEGKANKIVIMIVVDRTYSYRNLSKLWHGLTETVTIPLGWDSRSITGYSPLPPSGIYSSFWDASSTQIYSGWVERDALWE